MPREYFSEKNDLFFFYLVISSSIVAFDINLVRFFIRLKKYKRVCSCVTFSLVREISDLPHYLTVHSRPDRDRLCDTGSRWSMGLEGDHDTLTREFSRFGCQRFTLLNQTCFSCELFVTYFTDIFPRFERDHANIDKNYSL